LVKTGKKSVFLAGEESRLPLEDDPQRRETPRYKKRFFILEWREERRV
jgi:hypothetical protein